MNWLERNRKIYWGEGVVAYHEYQEIMTDIVRNRHIYTKGSDKVLLVQHILENNNVYNLEDKGCLVCQVFKINIYILKICIVVLIMKKYVL